MVNHPSRCWDFRPIRKYRKVPKKFSPTECRRNPVKAGDRWILDERSWWDAPSQAER